MKMNWKKGLSLEAKKAIELEFNASGLLRERLAILINEKIHSNNKKCKLEVSYESPNWALLQADNVGYERALLEVLSLLE